MKKLPHTASDSPSDPPAGPAGDRPDSNGRGTTRYQLGTVALVSLVLATVFTAWTPASLTSSASRVNAIIATRRAARAEAGEAVVTATEPPRPRIGIVAGHKGNDSGAICPDGLTEAAVNLDVATRVQVALEALGFQVDLLDEFDARLTQYQALALVSIHADSCEYISDTTTGFKVAAAQDSAVPVESSRLVSCLTDRYALATGLAFHVGSITFDMTKYHTFYEINSRTPAAIIEVGFLNLDRALLTERPERVAQGVIDGILCYAMNEPVPRNPATATAVP